MNCTICEENESFYWLNYVKKEEVIKKEPICLECKLALENEIAQGSNLPFEFEIIEKIKVKRLQK